MYYSYNFLCIGNVLGVILKIISGLLFNFIIHSACLSDRIKIFSEVVLGLAWRVVLS